MKDIALIGLVILCILDVVFIYCCIKIDKDDRED